MTSQITTIAPSAPPILVAIDLPAAMGGLSPHTQRAYRRWITRYLVEAYGLDKSAVHLDALPTVQGAGSLLPAMLKAWLGLLKEAGLGKQSLQQAKAAVVWLAQALADAGVIPYSVPAGLSRISAPKAETGQRAGTWLTSEQIKKLIAAARELDSTPTGLRNVAIIVLVATCGLRRAEVPTILCGDVLRVGKNTVLRVHGKGEKLRTIKLPDMAVEALTAWKVHLEPCDDNTPLFSVIGRWGQASRRALNDDTVFKLIVACAKRAGLPRITPHDLRRTFARGAYEEGVSFELIRQSLGHSSIATTEHYVNSKLELDRAASDIWAEALEQGL